MTMGTILGISDTLWNTFAGALFGGLIASGIVAYLTQQLIEKRERRNRRDELRLDMYLEVVDIILENEQVLGERAAEARIPPIDIQIKRLRILHRLKLLGSLQVQAAYTEYDKLVFQSTVQEIQFRPRNPEDVSQSRDRLVQLMAKDVGPQH
jgi:hypothetical protein